MQNKLQLELNEYEASCLEAICDFWSGSEEQGDQGEGLASTNELAKTIKTKIQNMSQPTGINQDMTPQQFYDGYMELKNKQKEIQEQINGLEEFFANKFGLDLEYPVATEEGKKKYIRIYRPEGRFVYNTEFEIGLRQTAKNKAPGVE